MLELNNVTVTYPGGAGSLTALDHMDLQVDRGELVALVGPSGCGKTTVLNVLAGQVKPAAGTVRLAGEPVKGVLPSVGYISQADTLLPWRSVLDNVALAMELRGWTRPPAGSAPGPSWPRWAWRALRKAGPGSSPGG